MCGIAGFFDSSKARGSDALRSIVAHMSDQLVARGPDAEGFWVDARDGIAFGHRRLAVIDLSSEGHQPMHSACGRYVIIFNGEIYNHKALRKTLTREGLQFRGHSDTEVMLASIAEWGLREALEKFNGMFAFALWDRSEKRLSLCRDRLGEKPLYYGWSGKSFLFGSELKGLAAHPDFEGKIDRNALCLYLRHNYIPAPYSIYQDIYKLPPGSMLTLHPSSSRSLPEPEPYWSFLDLAQNGIDQPFRGSAAEAQIRLDALLKDAVQLRMEADVPLGAFLSGGIDSSTIVAIMQNLSPKPIRTFTIGFHESGYNEAKEARAIADHLKTDHTELYVSPKEAMEVIPHLPHIYDEPFADVSQIPTYLVSHLARQDVTVALSGDGGDELFCGYPRYPIAKTLCSAVGWIPKGTRRFLARGLSRLSALPFRANQIQRLSDILVRDTEATMYREMISHVNHPEEVVMGGREPATVFSGAKAGLSAASGLQRLMSIDTQSYLPDDVLVKVDRASMAVGLESRVPFLDHRVLAFAWRLPISMQVQGNTGKALIRRILGQYIPKPLFDRPKMGFGIPIDAWLKGPLRDWGESLVNEQRLREEGYLNAQYVRKKWREHQSGKAGRHYLLWTLLMFQSWLDERARQPAPSILEKTITFRK